MKGVIIKSTGSWYSVMDEEGNVYPCRIKGKFRLQGIKSTNPIAVGDRVVFDKEPGEKAGVIFEIEDRKNYIIRKSINLSKQTHVIAANIDQALLVVTLVLPRTSTGFIDRFLVTADAYSIPVTILFNKSDILKDDDELKNQQNQLMEVYQRIGYRCLTLSAFDKEAVEQTRSLMKDKVNLLSGHSGVGKSTLINAIEPGLKLKTGDISWTHLKGMHTTTFAEMFPLSFGGFVIDTPGIKELGITTIEKEELAHFFPEMRKLMNECRFNNCQHINEPNCAIKAAVESGEIAESRYYSYLSIYNSEEMEDEF
jgi:ribosome biogenesis GTPase / thiamine phosphate phosphatase